MEYEFFIIEIEGKEVSDLYRDIISLEVELDDELASMFRLRLAMPRKPDETWNYLDDQRLSVWKKVSISAGFDNGAGRVMEGVITSVMPRFDPDIALCSLEIWGMDRSILMDREEKLMAWPNRKDSDIAAEILESYGFDCRGEDKVDDTDTIHDESVSTIIQRETDMQFLNRLALRNGFQCYVDGKEAFFRAPKLNGDPQPVLAVHCDADTNVTRFSLELDVLRPSHVSMAQMERTDKKVIEVKVSASELPEFGGKGADELLTGGMKQAMTFVDRSVTTGSAEMMALCQGLFRDAGWFVTGEGEIAGNIYGHVLKPRETVTIKGVGETYSGLYYVSHVTHSFTTDGYLQRFRVKRNAIM